MEGEGMVAVVRGLRDAGLAVTLLDGSHQYTLTPNSITHINTTPSQRGAVTNSNASTQPAPPKNTADSSTESSIPQIDSCAQAVDGRYASMYKTMHCNMRPTSPPVQLTEFPPQRPDLCPGHGNFQVGGTGSGATYSPIRASSPVSFRGGLSWPDRGSVCSPRPSHEVDAFANSLRKYPNLSPDRSSEVMERLINYTQAKGLSYKSCTRNQNSPTRLSEPGSHHTIEPKATTRISRGYEPEITIRSKRVEEPPTRERKKEEHYDRSRSYDVRCIRDMSKRLRDNVKAMSSYPYNHPVCPTIKENHYCHIYPTELNNSSNSVNMEIQAAVKMISKEVCTVHRDPASGKSVAQDIPSSPAGEENNEGECYYVQCLDTNTSFKSIQTTFCPSDETLRPKKSAQTVCSSVDLKSKQRKRFVGRKNKSQEEIKLSKDELRRSLLELIDEVSSSSKSKKLIRDELIKKLFDTDRSDRCDNKSDRGKSKRERIDKYVSTFCPSGCDYVGDFKELVGKLKQSYGDTKLVMHTTVKPFRISEYKKLDDVLKDWINNLNIKIKDTDRSEMLNTVEDKIKELFKNRTKQDFDLKSGIVKIIEEIPIEVHQSYNKKSYLHRLVDVLLKRLKNVVINQQNGRGVKKIGPVNKSKKILTEDDIRDFVREHLMDFFNECHIEICEYEMDDLENALIDILIDSIDCIRCGHIDDASDEMEIILQDFAQLTDKQADYISRIILQNLQELLNNCNFNQTYTILHSNVNSGQHSNNTTDNDFSIGGITEGDLNANLDRYTNQLSQRINEWLDNLNLPEIQDKGFREVVVNDLAGDIVDRHKYIELNQSVKDSQQDELEALKYQIFKWINKLVGEENTETIRHAPELLQKINSVPVPMLTNPQGRRMNNSAGGQQKQPLDPMRPCLGETGGNTCRSKNKSSSQSTQGPSGSNAKTSQNNQGSPGPHSTGQTSQNQSGTNSNVSQSGQPPQGYFSQNAQGSPGSLGHYSHQGQGGQFSHGFYGQGFPNVQGSSGGQTIGPVGQYRGPGGQSIGPGGQTITMGGQIIRPGGQTIGTGGQFIGPGGQTIALGGQIIRPGVQILRPGGQITGLGGQTIGPGGQTTGPGGQTIGPDGQPIGSGGQPLALGGLILRPGGQITGLGGQTIGSGGQTTGPGGQTTGPGGLIIRPGGQITSSGGQTIGPGGQSIGSGGQPLALGGLIIRPGGQSTGPGGQTTGPGGLIIRPGGQTTSPGGQTTGPGGQSMGPGGQPLAPGGLIIRPGGQNIGPGGQITGLGGQTIGPGGQTTGPGGQTTSSGGQTTSSGGLIISPGGQITSLGGQTIASGGQTTGPGGFSPPFGTMSSPGKSQGPNQNWNRPTTFSSGALPSSAIRNPAGNFSLMPMYELGSAGPTPGRMSSPAGMAQQSMYVSNQQSMFGAGPGVMVSPQGAQNTTLTGSVTPGGGSMGGMGRNISSSGPCMVSLGAVGTSVGKFGSCCINQDGTAPIHPSLKRLNDQYDEYLQQWVQHIPIPATKPEEQQSAERARLSIYNGIWKAITKIKLDPEIFSNSYNYQDAFHEELDALLGSVPKSQELESNKHRLKAELLEKTLAMNEMIRSTNAPASFKQQIIENVGNHLPRRNDNKQDPTQQNEEIQKINLAEHYILYTRYKDEDSLKANVHKKNFLKKLNVFLDSIRKKYGIGTDTTAYANEIINSLDRIPIPHLNAFKEEADDILLGMEVENWISDLPQNPDNTLPLEKRRLRDAIVMKVQEIGSIMSYNDSSLSKSLKKELPKYLEKMPIKPGTNIDFVIEELANRLKNISKDMKQKSVSFQESLNYQEFSKNMPASSSIMDNSYNIEGGNVVKDSPKSWVNYKTQTSVENSLQWQSLQETQVPSGLVNWSQGQQSLQPQPYVQNISGQIPASGNYASDFSYGNAVPVQNQMLGSSGTYGQIYSNVQSSPLGQMPSQGLCCSNTACLNKPRSRTQGLTQSLPYSGQQGQIPQVSYGQGFSNVQSNPPAAGQMPSQGPCCGNIACPNRPHSLTQTPPGHSQVNQGPYGQGFPNVGGSPLPYNQGQSFDQASRAYSQVPTSIQGGFGGKSMNATQIGQVPQGSYGQGSPSQYNQGKSFGSVPAAYDQVLPSIQGSTGGAQMSQFPQEYSGQGVPNTSYNQGQSFGTVSAPFAQVSPNVQTGLELPGQMHSQGPNATYTSQGPQASYGQGYSNVQDGAGSIGLYNQSQGFDPGQVSYGQMPQNIQGSLPMNQIYSQGPSTPQGTPVSYQLYDQGFLNVQGMDPYSQGLQAPYAQGSPAYTSQVPISGLAGFYDQEYQSGQPPFLTVGDQSQQTKNQTAQSSGPVSAASQVPDSSRGAQQNLQEMAGGGMGILGTSQAPGPSTQQSGAQQPAGFKSTDSEGIKQSEEQNKKQPATSTPVCPNGLLPSCIGPPLGCSTLQQQQNQNRHCPCKSGTVYKEHVNITTESKTSEKKPLDINERQIINIKSVQTACSTIDIKTTKCKYCEIRSKSQEELTKITKTQEVIKRKDVGKLDIQNEVTEWFEIHSDKVKVKLWGDKMQKLAEKLKKPGGEEKLRMKIEKYLKKVPDQFSEGDDDKLEFRKQLPDDIIRKLKKMYLNPSDGNENVNIYRMELFKYCSRFKMNNFKKVIMNWLKNLNIKKKDFLGRNVKKDDVFKYVTDKLEPLVLDRPKSDTEYKNVLKSNITDIIDDLPLVLGSINKEFYVNKVTETLVNDIFNIESKVPSTYIQPTTREIKEFVKDEITFFLEKSHVAISTKRIECLETELIDILLDLTDIVDIDNYVMEDVTTVLKDVGKLPEYKAKYFSNILLRDYKEFFFRPRFFQEKDKTDFGHPDVYSIFQNTTDMVDINGGSNVDEYMQQLVQEIFKWLSNLNIPNKDKHFTEVTVKDLACDIVDRHKYLAFNPNTRRTDAEELEHLKYQIFKWTHKFVGEGNTAILEHAQELMERINDIPKPSTPSLNNNETMSPPTAHVGTDTKCFNEKLIEEIYDWFHELPIDFHVSQDASLNIQLIKDLADDIETGLIKKDVRVIDEEVSELIKNVFNNKLNGNYVEQLINRIKSIPFTEQNIGKNHKQEKVLIRYYEDIVDEWLDTVPIEPKKEGLFINNINEFIHELAVKIYNNKTRLHQSPDLVIEKKLQENISDWMKKLPLHLQIDKQYYRDTYAANLIKNIQACVINDSIEIRPQQTDEEFIADQLEEAILHWLKDLPLYRNKSLKDKDNQEAVMKELASKINVALSDGHFNPDDDIINHIKMLDPNQNDDTIQDTALQLKLYLQKLNMFGDISQRSDDKDDIFVANIEIWINELPLDVNDENYLENQKKDFIESMKRLKSSGSDSGVLKKEILTFMNTLPLDRSKRGDIKYLDEEASKLIQNLTVLPVEDESRKAPLESNEIVRDAVKEWIRTLPLNSVYCPRELRTLIDDMSIMITSLVVHPEYTMTEENYQRLHRIIIKFLRRFPLKQERRTETDILRMAKELANNLKEINLYRDYNEQVSINNITVYGVSLNTNTTDNDFSIRSIQEDDINANLDRYTKQLIHQISIWFNNLNLPNIQEEGFKEVVINDLAGDIIDRHKYLELNPQSGGQPEEELEHLKYQIFKWINKLVGEDNLETINHADDLMQRIQSIPVPMLVRLQDKGQILSSHSKQQSNHSRSASPGTPPVIRQQVNVLPTSDAPTGEGSFREPPKTQQPIPNRMSSPGALGIPNTKCCTQEPPPPPPTPQQGTKEAIYEKYQKIFREKCKSLPIDTSTPENAKLAELAKTGIYNGIVKTFFKLKSDPEIENDYGYFEFMFEEKLEEMLDILPQTEELISKRHAWKLEILASVIDMLEELHTLTDRPSFRQRVRNKFNRNFARDLELEECFLLQQGFLAEMADAYILETKYKEEDPMKANVYKHRLMKKTDDLANHLAKEHNVGFRFFKKAQLIRIAMKVLEQVPIPKDNILKEEAEEIQLADEIEKWYKELPTKPLVNATDGVLRKRMMDLLAKKIYDIERCVKNQDPSKESQMKHEMSQFLEKRAKLQQDQDLNINLMVDELNNRIKNQWLKQPADYKSFEKEKPFSSTFAQVDNNEFLAPLMDAATSTTPLQGQVHHEPGGQDALKQQQPVLQTSCCKVGPSQGYATQPGHQVHSMGQLQSPPKASFYGVNVDTSQTEQSQSYVSHSILDSGQGRPPSAGPHADNLVKSHHGPNEVHIPHQAVPMHSMGPGQSSPRPSPYGTGLDPSGIGLRQSQVGPSEGYVSQSPRIQSMGQKVTSPRSMQASHVESSQYRPDERYISQQGPPPQNLSQVATSPRSMHGPQASPIGSKSSYVTQQGQPMSKPSQNHSPQSSTPYGSNIGSQGGAAQVFTPQQGSATNKSMRRALGNSQHASVPIQNMNQSIQQDLTSQPGLTPQELYDQNMLIIPTVYGPQGQLEFSPSYLNPGISPTDIPGYIGSRGPTSSQGAGSTAQIPGAPDEAMREEMELDYLMRCRCLEAYRKRRRCFEYDDRCPRLRPYRCYF